jgi:hypothetical protein
MYASTSSAAGQALGTDPSVELKHLPYGATGLVQMVQPYRVVERAVSSSVRCVYSTSSRTEYASRVVYVDALVQLGLKN